MSVIAGFLGPEPQEPGRIVEGMLAGFRSYGSDGSPRFSGGRCAMGVEVLAIEPGQRGKSSSLYVYGESCAVFDGRLDELDELRVELGLARESGAAEAIFCAYRKYGDEFVCRLRGEFALVVWDPSRRTVIAARDVFGVRPLYYACIGQSLLLASDPEQVIASGMVSTAPDEEMVIDYLLRNPRSTSKSFFRDIRGVPPGHFMRWTGGSVQTWPYRVAIAEFSAPTRDAYWSEYRYRFDTAVAKRMRSGYPVIAELSGGMDSSSIVCTAGQVAANDPSICPRIIAAAGIYTGLSCDEESFVNAVARMVKLPVVKWDGTRGAVYELAESSIHSPGARFATFAGNDGQMQIARDAGARIVLSGFGGDQIGMPAGGPSRRSYGEALA